jgi:hypothetical protein
MDTLTFIDEEDYRTRLRDVNIARNGSFRSGGIRLFFVAGQKPIDFFREHLEWKRSRDRHGRLFLRRLNGRSHEDEPRCSVKSPLIGFLAIFENRLGIPPVVHTPFKRGLVQPERDRMLDIDLLVQPSSCGK